MQRPLDEGAPQQRLSFGEKRSSTVTANPGPSNPGPAPGPNFLSSVFAARRSSERSEPLHGLWQRFRQCVSCWSIAQRKYRVEEKKKKSFASFCSFTAACLLHLPPGWPWPARPNPAPRSSPVPAGRPRGSVPARRRWPRPRHRRCPPVLRPQPLKFAALFFKIFACVRL